MMISRVLLLIALLALCGSADDEPFRARIRVEKSKDMILNRHGMAFLPANHLQKGQGIFLQAEQMSGLEYNQPETRLHIDNDHIALIHVRFLEFSFEVTQSGRYRAWYYATYPTNLNYLHAECMDEGKLQTVHDSQWLTPNVWRWSKGPVYQLDKGKHTWSFPSPNAWCGGTKLDCLILAPETMTDSPQRITAKDTLVQLPERGDIYLRRIKASMLKTWQMSFASDLNGGSIQVNYRYDQAPDWQPLRPGAWEKVPSKADYLFFHIHLERAKDRLISPFLYNLKLMVQER